MTNLSTTTAHEPEPEGGRLVRPRFAVFWHPDPHQEPDQEPTPGWVINDPGGDYNLLSDNTPWPYIWRPNGPATGAPQQLTLEQITTLQRWAGRTLHDGTERAYRVNGWTKTDDPDGGLMLVPVLVREMYTMTVIAVAGRTVRTTTPMPWSVVGPLVDLYIGGNPDAILELYDADQGLTHRFRAAHVVDLITEQVDRFVNPHELYLNARPA